jgi:hypothetical protein
MLFAAASSGASAQTQDCRAIADPTAQLACYNNDPTPPPAQKRRPASPAAQRAKSEPEKSAESLDAEDAVMRARINGICRGC